jgi:branched-chain amino acid transport system permease protein
MQQFWQQVVLGLESGSIYASLALALVLVYRATGVVNFAQGEMAMFTTYIASTLLGHGLSYWQAFGATLALAFVGGLALERVVIRPVEHAPELAIVVVTVGLLIALNGAATWIWGPEIKFFPSMFPTHTSMIRGVAIPLDALEITGVTLGIVITMFLFFRYTKLGLALRASATEPNVSRLLGVRVGWMLALGWGLAALLGAVSGLLAAPIFFLQPNMMQGILLYAFAAAVLGGIDSPVGAVVGGLAIGVGVNLLTTYVHAITPELQLPVALGILLLVLVVRPAGLFGEARVERV